MSNKEINQDKQKVTFPQSEISRRELLKRLSPLGKVEMDASQCTGCGLCALECPTGALAVASGKEADAFRLLFKHGLCVACSRCVEICPEKCLRLERVLELDKMNSQSVLFEDKIIMCSGCGGPIGPKKMIDKLRAVVAAHSTPSHFELCPACRVQAQLSRLRK